MQHMLLFISFYAESLIHALRESFDIIHSLRKLFFINSLRPSDAYMRQ